MTEKLRSVAVVGALALSMALTLEQVTEAAAPLTYEQPVGEGRQVLARDESSGRVVEAFGDLEHADAIVVFVPGASWNLQRFDEADAPMSPRTAARELVRRTDSDELAAVAWLGYQPPPGLGVSALRSERAEAGGRELSRFVDWLPEDASITLACHSYGGVVCGKAAPEAPVDNIVSIGGAGMDVANVRDLESSANIWVAQAPEDNIRFLPGFRFAGFGHGSSPVAEGFGGYQVDTGEARAHADYYRPDGTTMTNLRLIAEGRYAEVAHA